MADIRAMLKTERSARKVSHPHASYTSNGALSCKICRVAVKSAGLWDSHLRSDSHLANLKKVRQPSGPDVLVAGRKRKASEHDGRDGKRVRNESLPAVVEEEEENDESGNKQDVLAASPRKDEHESADKVDEAHVQDALGVGESSVAATKDADAVDEDEWAAFERDMEQLDRPEQAAVSALQAAPTISAAPMTAEQIAAQAREEQSTQKGARETELEEEQEEAETRTEEELGRMTQLDERMKELRARREALRRPSQTESASIPAETKSGVEGKDESIGQESESDEDYDDEWATWGAR